MNDYESHHTFEFIDYCEKNKIISFDLSVHIIHILQFFDVIVFQLLKH